MEAAVAAVCAALITGLCSVLGQWLIAKTNKRKSDEERAVWRALNDERMERFEGKIDEHNGYAKRFEEVAVKLAEIETKIEILLKGGTL